MRIEAINIAANSPIDRNVPSAAETAAPTSVGTTEAVNENGRVKRHQTRHPDSVGAANPDGELLTARSNRQLPPQSFRIGDRLLTHKTMADVRRSRASDERTIGEERDRSGCVPGCSGGHD